MISLRRVVTCTSLCCYRRVGDGALFVFQAEDGIRDLVRSRGLGDVYKRQGRTDALQPIGEDRIGIEPGLIAEDRLRMHQSDDLSLIHI